MGVRRSRAVFGCAGLVGGMILGLVLGVIGSVIDLALYWRHGGEAAGTEVILVYVYAVPGAVFGAIAGLIGGLLLGGKR